jgi:hypothetical protein
MKQFTEYEDHVRRAVRHKMGLGSKGQISSDRMNEALELCAKYEAEGVPQVETPDAHDPMSVMSHPLKLTCRILLGRRGGDQGGSKRKDCH